jgi:hypothetical protein
VRANTNRNAAPNAGRKETSMVTAAGPLSRR